MQTSLRQSIRTKIRNKRLGLSDLEIQNASQLATVQLLNHPIVKHAQHVALFRSFAGEIDTQYAIEAFWQANKSVYLPVLHPFNSRQLLFLHFTQDSALIKNRFGILEPQLTVQTIKPIQHIDLFITPLTAFDRQGGRLGMGGGFYDYSLSHCDRSIQQMIGFAYAWQEVDHVPTEEWDLKLDSVVTDKEIIFVN